MSKKDPHALSNAMHNGIRRPLPTNEDFILAARLLREAMDRAKLLPKEDR